MRETEAKVPKQKSRGKSGSKKQKARSPKKHLERTFEARNGTKNRPREAAMKSQNEKL